MPEADEMKEEVKAPLIGVVDGIVLAVAVAGLLFYLYRRFTKREAEVYEFTPIQPPMNRSPSVESGFIARMKSSGRNVAVFYGSQTGTAEDLAGRLAKDAVRFGMKGIALDLEECDMDDLSGLTEIENGLAIFCLATYGEGDPTDNAQEFYEWLQRGDADLAGLNYAVFALGNKTYEHFNAMGTYTDTRLLELKAHRVHECGMGDDDGNLEEDFMIWRDSFWPAVCELFGVEAVGDDVSMRQYTLKLWTPEELEPARIFRGEIARLNAFKNQRPPYDVKNPYLAPVAINAELHGGGDRSCKHIEFDISSARMRYDAGDHLGVYPTNDSRLVQRFGELLAVDLDQAFSLINNDEDSSKKHPFPCPTTYRVALTHYVDITTPPRTNVLKEMAEYCADEDTKQFLLAMTSSQEDSRHKYIEWIVHDHRSIIDVLSDLPTCRPPIDHLLELLPRLQPRYYSISSCPKYKEGVVTVTAVVLSYSTRLNREVRGVCTNYLAEKQLVGEDPELRPKVPIYVRKSTLRLPHRVETPVIMIGPGTGIAPFMGFIQQRALQKREGKPVGATILYFGCRKRAEDYIYAEQLEAFRDEGVLSELHCAFSRDQAEKVYVQHLLRQNAESTWKLLNDQSAHLYVCGDARNMARDVQETITDLVSQYGGMSPDAAKDYFKKLESAKRYQADVWS